MELTDLNPATSVGPAGQHRREGPIAEVCAAMMSVVAPTPAGTISRIGRPAQAGTFCVRRAESDRHASKTDRGVPYGAGPQPATLSNKGSIRSSNSVGTEEARSSGNCRKNEVGRSMSILVSSPSRCDTQKRTGAPKPADAQYRRSPCATVALPKR
jgi:hypothetical protein